MSPNETVTPTKANEQALTEMKDTLSPEEVETFNAMVKDHAEEIATSAQADHDAMAEMIHNDTADGHDLSDADKAAAQELIDGNIDRFKTAKKELADLAIEGQLASGEPFPAKEKTLSTEELVAANYQQAFSDSHNVPKQ
jgi:hypothetical protein